MSNLSIKPLADRVVVEPAQAEEKTAFGIIIPDTAKEKPQKGLIVVCSLTSRYNGFSHNTHACICTACYRLRMRKVHVL